MAVYEVNVPYMQVPRVAIHTQSIFNIHSWFMVVELPDGTGMESYRHGGFDSEQDAYENAMESLNATLIESDGNDND